MTINGKSSRLTDADLAVLRAMFLDREGAPEVLRKIFFPELTADDPIMLNGDMWSVNFDLDSMTAEQQIIAIKAHQKLIKHVEGCLKVIGLLVGTKEESAEEAIARVRKDSAK